MVKRHRRKAKKGLKIAVLLLAIALVGGGAFFAYKKLNTPSNGDETKPSKNTKVEKKVKVIDEESDSRPYAVMINNNSAVWKYQSGLNEAYIIYEMPVEGGITREMALYKDTDTKKIASVRSSRHYFLDYALENDAIYVHWGWSPQAQSDIKSLKINNINGLTYEGSYFFRDSSIKGIGMEHKGYTTMESLKKAADRLKYRTTTEKDDLLKYEVDPIDMNSYEGVVDAKEVEIPYSGSYTARFYYDEETKMYKKSQNKTEMIDYTSKERINTKNIIVYNAIYNLIDSKGRLDMKNIGEGSGYFISEGKAVPINWKKSSRSGTTKYTFKDGKELKVNDGRTYIGIQPNDKKVKFTSQEA